MGVEGATRISKVLETFLSCYGGVPGLQPHLLQVILQMREEFGGRRVLYPGSFPYVVPSLVFPLVCYVDSLKGISRALTDPDCSNTFPAQELHGECRIEVL